MWNDSVFKAGVAGMQQSQNKLQQISHDVARLNTHSNPRPVAPVETGPVARGASTPVDLPLSQAVSQFGQSAATARGANRDLPTLMVEQKRQQLVFNASAKVVHTASKTLGSLINEWS